MERVGDRWIMPTPSMPLRDALRAVRTARAVSLQMLRPAERGVPFPLRVMAEGAREAADRASSLAIGQFPPSPKAMAAAASVLRGAPLDRAARKAFVRVFALGLERCLAEIPGKSMLVSETVAAASLAPLLRGADRPLPTEARAAELAISFSRSHVAGRIPGTGLALSHEQRASVDVAVVATLLWLITERPADAGEEEDTLRLCAGIVTALRAEVAATFDKPSELERKLVALAAMISGNSSEAAALKRGGSRLPVRKAIRSLRWFFPAFEQQLAQVSAETGIRYTLDRSRLAAAFVEWSGAFEDQKPRSEADRLPYVGFAAGLMLRALVRAEPALAARPAAHREAKTPAEIWPEGYLYVAFCLRIRALVLEQDFDCEPSPGPAYSDPETWWSFRENTGEDPSLAIAFLELFAGENPSWTMPDSFRPTPGRCPGTPERDKPRGPVARD